MPGSIRQELYLHVTWCLLARLKRVASAEVTNTIDLKFRQLQATNPDLLSSYHREAVLKLHPTTTLNRFFAPHALISLKPLSVPIAGVFPSWGTKTKTSGCLTSAGSA